jgi:uncharacterized protein (DUF2141 family)
MAALLVFPEMKFSTSSELGIASKFFACAYGLMFQKRAVSEVDSSGGLMYRVFFVLAVLLTICVSATAQSAPSAAQTYTLTIQVEGVNNQGGNIGVLVFTSDKGWAEDRTTALKDIVVPAHPGTVTVTIPNLPAGNYAVSIAHDVNQNHKLDKNFLGKPKEQWGLSNNPHAVLTAPPFKKCQFALKEDLELHITMQM